MVDYETVYRRYFQTVYRYLLSLCRDATLAEEITQAACNPSGRPDEDSG